MKKIFLISACLLGLAGCKTGQAIMENSATGPALSDQEIVQLFSGANFKTAVQVGQTITFDVDAKANGSIAGDNSHGVFNQGRWSAKNGYCVEWELDQRWWSGCGEIQPTADPQVYIWKGAQSFRFTQKK